jgi:hypothetical protein
MSTKNRMSVLGFKGGPSEVVEGSMSKQDTVGKLSDFVETVADGVGQ